MNKIHSTFWGATLLGLQVLIGADSALAAAEKAGVIIETSLNIQVIEDEKERQQLLAEAEKIGGYYIENATRAIQLRIPSEKLMPYLEFIRGQWRVYSQEYQSHDAANELLEKQTELAVKTELLSHYQKMFANAQSGQLVKVGKAADQLVTQVEAIKGRIAYLEKSMEYALVSIQLAEPIQQPQNARSTFEWINQTGLSQVVQGIYVAE